MRDCGEMLARDLEAVRQMGRDLAAKLGVTPTPPKNFGMAKDHATALSNLKAANGKAFDRAFLQHEVAGPSPMAKASCRRSCGTSF